MAEKKSRAWWGVVYPESAPDNWLEKAQEYMIPMMVSPLHDRDVNPDGEVKKAHYHVVLAWEGPTTQSNAFGILKSFGAVPQPKPIGSLRGVARYLTHMDNPEKFQYSPSDVRCYGIDYTMITQMASDKYLTVSEILDFCMVNQVDSFTALMLYARQYRSDSWFPVLCTSSAYIVREFIKSLYFDLNRGYDPVHSVEIIREMEVNAEKD